MQWEVNQIIKREKIARTSWFVSASWDPVLINGDESQNFHLTAAQANQQRNSTKPLQYVSEYTLWTNTGCMDGSVRRGAIKKRAQMNWNKQNNQSSAGSFWVVLLFLLCLWRHNAPTFNWPLLPAVGLKLPTHNRGTSSKFTYKQAQKLAYIYASAHTNTISSTNTIINYTSQAWPTSSGNTHTTPRMEGLFLRR